MKISFDYDGTFNTAKGKELANKRRSNGDTIYIISARDSKASIDGDFVPASRIYATGSNSAKVQKVKDLRIDKHYDNNEDVINQLDSIGILFTN